MKSKFTILVCMLLSLFTYSQTFSDYCPMDESSIADPEGAYSYSMDPTVFQSTEPIVLNVFYWQVKNPDGTYFADFTEEKLLESVALLNIKFNQFNIFFKYKGYDSFNSPPDVIKNKDGNSKWYTTMRYIQRI